VELDVSFDPSGLLWVLVGWLLACVCVGAALARWFRYLR
jgi:hypothetical protein